MPHKYRSPTGEWTWDSLEPQFEPKYVWVIDLLKPYDNYDREIYKIFDDETKAQIAFDFCKENWERQEPLLTKYRLNTRRYERCKVEEISNG